VLIHTTCNVYNSFSSKWNVYLCVNSLTTFAVPCFFLISGAFLIGKAESIDVFLKKRIVKIILVLIFWSLIYIIFKALYLKENISMIKSIISIAIEPQYFHLWFMYSIASLYFITPVIRIIYKHSDKISKIYTLLFFLLIPTCIITVEVLVSTWMPISRVFWYFPELGYFLLGAMIISKPSSYYKSIRTWLVPLIFISYILVVISSDYISLRAGVPKKDFINYDKLFVLSFSVSIFCMMYSFEEALQKLSHRMKSILVSISKVSMGIYLIHPLVMGIVGNVTLIGLRFTSNDGTIWNMILGAVLYFTLSYFICLVISKIPVLRRAVAS